jgi:hypothetical protein
MATDKVLFAHPGLGAAASREGAGRPGGHDRRLDMPGFAWDSLNPTDDEQAGRSGVGSGVATSRRGGAISSREG